MKKISEWLAGIDPWGIYVSTRMKERFTTETGLESTWPEHTPSETNRIMAERGLGGRPVHGTDKVCWGYEIAVALATTYTPAYRCTKLGRGSAFYEAVEALQQANL